MDIDILIDALIDREGDFSDHPADRGGATRWGVTEAVARADGYAGAMRDFPRSAAVALYRRTYWVRPAYDRVAERAPSIAAELFDTGVNMGPAVATTFLQRALNALNCGASDYPDVILDGRIGAQTLAALDRFLARRGRSGDRVAEGDRGVAGRTLSVARRAPSGERGVSLRLAREPYRIAAGVTFV